MALQLQDGNLELLVDYGSGTTKIHHYNDKVDDGELHKVEIILNPAVSISLYFVFYSHYPTENFHFLKFSEIKSSDFIIYLIQGVS